MRSSWMGIARNVPRPALLWIAVDWAQWIVMLSWLTFATTAKADDFLYTTNWYDGTLEIDRYIGSGGAVVIPSFVEGTNVTSIGNLAFDHCTNVTSVTIPNSITRIWNSVFQYCRSLTSVTIPDSVTTLGYDAFKYCGNLTNATIGNSVSVIQYEAFQYCSSLSSITIPDSVNTIEHDAFYSCTNLASATIGNGVTLIGFFAFRNCTRLTNIIIGDSVSIIGDGAFTDCSGLTSVTIPDSVTSIGLWAFENCTSLTRIMIPQNLNSIGGLAFGGCTSMTGITVDVSNANYSSVDGVLFNKSQTTVIQCPGGKAGSYTVPDSVTSIAGSAFNSCANLARVVMPNSVTNIGYQAFASCTSLAEVYILGNAPGLGSSVFSGANNATIYYLWGTTGWSTPFGGRPAVLWDPQVRNGADFGVQTNQFGFTIIGASNLVIVVEACANLTNSKWSPLGTNTLIGGASYFSDLQWTNYPTAFYRFRAP